MGNGRAICHLRQDLSPEQHLLSFLDQVASPFNCASRHVFLPAAPIASTRSSLVFRLKTLYPEAQFREMLRRAGSE
jgi:hypothetical protein